MTDYDPSRTALVLVDTYRDFLSEGGKIWPLVKDVAESVGLHRHLGALLAAVRTAGIPVFIAPHRRYHPGDFDGWQHLSGPHRTALNLRPFEVGTFGAEWQPELGPRDGDVVSTEHRGLSGFANTDLDQQLRQHGIEHIILAGMTAPGCVEGTGRYGMELGYSITLVKDATAAFNADYMHAAIDLNGPLYANAIVSTDELVADLSANVAA